MKNLALIIAFSLLDILAATAQIVNFSLEPNTQEEFSEKVRHNLDVKITQGLTRNAALAGGNEGIFHVVSTIVIDKMMVVDGEVSVANARGELTLVVKNAVDDSQFYSIVFPIRGSVLGNEEEALLDMVKRIKPTDPLFKKFVVNSRKNIKEYYSKNCSAIMQKAETYYRSKEYDKCKEYLSAMPETSDCYSNAAFLIDMCNNVEHAE